MNKKEQATFIINLSNMDNNELKRYLLDNPDYALTELEILLLERLTVKEDFNSSDRKYINEKLEDAFCELEDLQEHAYKIEKAIEAIAIVIDEDV